MRKISLLSFVIFVLFFVSACNGINVFKNGTQVKSLTKEEAKTKLENFVNDYLLNKEAKIVMGELIEEGSLYKVELTLPNGQKLNSAISKDGKFLYPETIDIAKMTKETDEAKKTEKEVEEKKKADMQKTDKPKVELFVMAYCPYGTQTEKGILPVVDLLKDKIDFSIKFVDYAMHQKKEIDEQIVQYCVDIEQKDLFFPYLSCFLKDGNSEICLKETKVDETKLKNCIAQTDEKFSISKDFNDQSKWKGQFPLFNIYKEENVEYGVQGSPTLIVNGTEVSTGNRAPQVLLSAICSGFTTAPTECQQQISSESPAPGFGFGPSASGASANSCEN